MFAAASEVATEPEAQTAVDSRQISDRIHGNFATGNQAHRARLPLLFNKLRQAAWVAARGQVEARAHTSVAAAMATRARL